jgi:hypothetical protein
VLKGAKRKERMELHAVLAMARELLSAGPLKALAMASRRATAVLPGEAPENKLTRSC